MANMLGRMQRLGLAGRELVLAAGMAAVYALIVAGGWLLSGGRGLARDAAIAASVCWVSAALALVISAKVKHPLAALLLSSGVRMGLPLSIVLVIHQYGGLRADMQVVYHLIVFYLAAVAIQTPLSLPVQRPESATDTACKTV